MIFNSFSNPVYVLYSLLVAAVGLYYIIQVSKLFFLARPHIDHYHSWVMQVFVITSKLRFFPFLDLIAISIGSLTQDLSLSLNTEQNFIYSGAWIIFLAWITASFVVLFLVYSVIWLVLFGFVHCQIPHSITEPTSLRMLFYLDK